MQISRDNICTTISSTVSTSLNKFVVPSANVPQRPYVVEFDKPTASTSNDFFIIDGKAIYLDNYGQGALKNANTVKFIATTNDTIEVYADGIWVGSSPYIQSSDKEVRFQINGTNNDITFKNFMIYKI